MVFSKYNLIFIFDYIFLFQERYNIKCMKSIHVYNLMVKNVRTVGTAIEEIEQNQIKSYI